MTTNAIVKVKYPFESAVKTGIPRVRSAGKLPMVILETKTNTCMPLGFEADFAFVDQR